LATPILAASASASASATGPATLAPPHLRVLHILEAVAGGTLRHLLDILQTVTDVEHHVVLPVDHARKQDSTSVNALATREIEASGATIHRIDMLRNPVHPKNLIGVARLRRLVARLQPTVVHGHSSIGGAFARVAVWGTSVPDVYTPNGVATSRAVLAVERLLAHRNSTFVAVSASEGERALQLGLTTRDRLVVIPNGIDLAPDDPGSFDLRKELQLHQIVPIVGTVARLAHQKAPEDFVRICADVSRVRSDVHFVLIGTGELQPQLNEAIERAGIADRFHQIPFLARASMAIQQMDVYVLASLFEGAAYSPLEAMKAGVPVVLSAVTGNTDTVVDKESGLLYPFGDTSAMAEGVLDLLAHPEVRQALVQAAHERVRRHFDRRDMSARLVGLYNDIALQRA
jgi:glycosyltransferase involved in cell wall biosynthesis